MHYMIYVPLAASALAAGGARPLAERLPPRTSTWLLTVSGVILAAASSAALGLLAVSASLRLPIIDSLGGMSGTALRHLHLAPLVVGLGAAMLFAVAAGSAVRAGWLRSIALWSAHRQGRRLAGGEQMVVIADPAVDAYALPGRPATIVVTTGMLDALTPAERAVLIAHERAHASGCHFVFTTLARLAAAANPLLRPLAASVAYTVERWADEEAARATGSRTVAARAVATAALAAAAAPPRDRTAVALGALPRVVKGRGTGSVPRRVGALLAPPPRRRLLLLTLATAVVAVSALAALDAAGSLHAVVELAQAATLS
jgi:Zn-dependent protease with chaperone function